MPNFSKLITALEETYGRLGRGTKKIWVPEPPLKPDYDPRIARRVQTAIRTPPEWGLSPEPEKGQVHITTRAVDQPMRSTMGLTKRLSKAEAAAPEVAETHLASVPVPKPRSARVPLGPNVSDKDPIGDLEVISPAKEAHRIAAHWGVDTRGERIEPDPTILDEIKATFRRVAPDLDTRTDDTAQRTKRAAERLAVHAASDVPGDTTNTDRVRELLKDIDRHLPGDLELATRDLEMATASLTGEGSQVTKGILDSGMRGGFSDRNLSRAEAAEQSRIGARRRSQQEANEVVFDEDNPEGALGGFKTTEAYMASIGRPRLRKKGRIFPGNEPSAGQETRSRVAELNADIRRSLRDGDVVIPDSEDIPKNINEGAQTAVVARKAKVPEGAVGNVVNVTLPGYGKAPLLVQSVETPPTSVHASEFTTPGARAKAQPDILKSLLQEPDTVLVKGRRPDLKTQPVEDIVPKFKAASLREGVPGTTTKERGTGVGVPPERPLPAKYAAVADDFFSKNPDATRLPTPLEIRQGGQSTWVVGQRGRDYIGFTQTRKIVKVDPALVKERMTMPKAASALGGRPAVLRAPGTVDVTNELPLEFGGGITKMTPVDLPATPLERAAGTRWRAPELPPQEADELQRLLSSPIDELEPWEIRRRDYLSEKLGISNFPPIGVELTGELTPTRPPAPTRVTQKGTLKGTTRRLDPKGLLLSLMAGTGLAGAAASQMGTPEEPPKDRISQLEQDLTSGKYQVQTAGPNLDALIKGIRNLVSKAAEMHAESPRPFRQGMDAAVMTASGALQGDPLTGGLAGLAMAAAEPPARTAQLAIQSPSVREALAPIQRGRDALRRGQQIKDLTGQESPGLWFRQRWIDRLSVVKDGLEKAAQKAGETGADALRKASMTLDLMFGGGMSDVTRRVYPLRQELQKVRDQGLEPYFTALVDLKGQQRAADVVREHAIYARGKAATAATLPERQKWMARHSEAMRALPMLLPRADEATTAIRALELELGPQKMAALEGPWQAFQQLAKDNHRYAFEQGLISKETYEGLARRPFYVPLHRETATYDPVRDELIESIQRRMQRPTGRLSLPEEKVYQELLGSLEPTKDPFEALYRMTVALQQEGARNTASKTLAQAIIPNVSLFREGERSLIRPVTGVKDLPNPATEGLLSWFEGGQRKDLVVPKLWADAVNFVQPVDVAAGFKTLSKFRGILQSMATGMNVAFAFRNMPRDVQDVAVLMGNKLRKPRPGGTAVSPDEFASLWGRAFKDWWGDQMTPERAAFLKSYADFSTITSHLTPEEGLWGYQPRGPLGQVGKQTRRFLNAGERATKQASFTALKKAGYDDVTAAALTRDVGGSPDFAKGGDMLPVARNFWMFFGPQVQGIDRMYRTYKAHPEMLAAHAAAITAGTLALYRYNSGFVNPDTGVPEIEMVPLTERRTNFIIMTGRWVTNSQGQTRMEYIKLPMGHTLQALTTPVMETLAAGQGTGSYPQAVMDSIANLLPGTGQIEASDPIRSGARGFLMGLNPLIKVPFEQALNMNTFTRAPIVGRRVEQRIPSEQWTERTSPTMVDLGQALGQVPLVKDTWLASPDRLEAAYRGILPGPGEQAMSLLDYWRRAPQARAPLESVTAAPVIGPIARSFLPSQGSQFRMEAGDKVFDAATRTQQLVATVNDLLKINPKRAEQMLSDPEVRHAMAMNRHYQAAAKQIALISREKIRVQNDRSIPLPQKREQMRQLYLAEIQILRTMGEAVDTETAALE